MATRKDVLHLCRRAGFGATKREIRRFTEMSLEDVVAAIVYDDRAIGEPAYDPPPPEMSENTCDTDAPGFDVAAVGRWYLDRMRDARFVAGAGSRPHPLREKMTLFWHGLLVSSFEKDTLYCSHSVILGQHLLFRQLALGDYEDLLRATSEDPAMALFLDNWLNTVDTINENFARELLELFSLGVGKYDQDDVRSVARAATGYGLDDDTAAEFFFNADAHDNGPKTLFGRRADWDLAGAAAGRHTPDVIAELCSPDGKQRQVARYVARLVWEYFAYFGPEDALLDELADAFAASGRLLIADLLTTVFNHPEFYSPRARTGKVKNPVEWTVMTMRALDESIPVYEDGYDGQFAMLEMGLHLFHQPTVFGWWRRPELRWISMPAFAAKATMAWELGAPALYRPDHRLYRLVQHPPGKAVDGVFGMLGIRLGRNSPVRRAGIRLVRRLRTLESDDFTVAIQLLRFAVLSPEVQTN